MTPSYGQDRRGDDAALVALFEAAFGEAEGPEEGAAVAGLVRELLAGTGQAAPVVHAAWAPDGGLIGAILFTPLRFAGDARHVVLMAPVAVAPEWQRQGVGRALIRQGLEDMRAGHGAQVAVTYGDPAYYSKLGFRQVSVGDVPPPHRLSQPEGWQAQALDAAAGPLRLQGPSACVAAFDDPRYW